MRDAEDPIKPSEGAAAAMELLLQRYEVVQECQAASREGLPDAVRHQHGGL